MCWLRNRKKRQKSICQPSRQRNPASRKFTSSNTRLRRKSRPVAVAAVASVEESAEESAEASAEASAEESVEALAEALAEELAEASAEASMDTVAVELASVAAGQADLARTTGLPAGLGLTSHTKCPVKPHRSSSTRNQPHFYAPRHARIHGFGHGSTAILLDASPLCDPTWTTVVTSRITIMWSGDGTIRSMTTITRLTGVLLAIRCYAINNTTYVRTATITMMTVMMNTMMTTIMMTMTTIMMMTTMMMMILTTVRCTATTTTISIKSFLYVIFCKKTVAK